MAEPSARVIADSISPDGQRLTTVEAVGWRPILAEQNTHRTFCLAGDAVLEFDLPSGSARGTRRVHRMTIADFVDRWHHGARRVEANPKRPLDLCVLEDDVFYAANDLAELVGYSRSGINMACRNGELLGFKDGKTWVVAGGAFKAWRLSRPSHTRFDISDRLSNMAIRQINESTGLIQTSTVNACVFSGEKVVYQVKAGDHTVAGSSDHRVWTPEGYKTIGELRRGDEIVVECWGRRLGERVDPDRLRYIGGQWRAAWQRKQRRRLLDEFGGCQKCGSSDRLSIHHIVEVVVDPSLAFEEDNILLLCHACHADQHRHQSWQTGNYLYGDVVRVDRIGRCGREETFDLEIAGEFPNFIANGVVVHNSRNSASSRAIPITKNLERFDSDFFWPAVWGSEQGGMQSGPPLEDGPLYDAQNLWKNIARYISTSIHQYVDAHPLVDDDGNKIEGALRLHKSLLNRWLEPGLGQQMIITGTSWDGYFWQRCHEAADANIRAMAEAIQAAMVKSTPKFLKPGEWHLPYFGESGGFADDWEHIHSLGKVRTAETNEEREREALALAKRISAGRCARVSSMNQSGSRDVNDDLRLYVRLADRSEDPTDPFHASPLEHVATPWPDNVQHVTMPNGKTMGPLPKLGNLIGWWQLRHEELAF